MAEIEDADIERVDAVDKPATRRKWLILKSEEEDEQLVNLEELQKAALAVIEAVQKEATNGELGLGQETVKALNALAKLIEADVQFKVKPKEGYGYPAPQKEVKTEENVVLKALEAQAQALAEIKEMLQKQPVAKAMPASKQLDDPAKIEKQTRKWGEGLFTDVVFSKEVV